MSGLPSVKIPTTGDIIDGKYVLESRIGKGGMGEVYKAHHRRLGHKVAIKVMLADAANLEAASRFVQEGRAAANIQNEHVVRVSDVGEEHGYAYMILDLLEGEDLAHLLDRERRLAPNVAVAYVLQALDGVRQAHEMGIVHRDLKPSNLFLAKRQDGTTVIKVLDFGISRETRNNPLGQAPGALTSTKAMLGSPLYMSPEQLRSSKSVDARADIWAMGVILYELMTGTLPFMGENLGELFAQILEVEAPPLRTRVPEAPALLEAIVARCLQRRPEHRFQTVADLERELAPLAAGASTSPFAASSVLSGQPRTVMMQTPPLDQVHAARASAAYGTPPPHAYQQMAQSPAQGTYPAQARGDHPAGSVTGSGAHVPVVKGTVPLGAITPQPYPQTDPAWQSTGTSTRSPNTVPLIIGGLALLALAGLGLGYASKKKGHDLGTTGNGGQTSASVTSSSELPAPPSSVTTATVADPVLASSSGVAGVAGVAVGSAVSPAVSPTPTTSASAVTAVPASLRHRPQPPVVRVDPTPPKPETARPPDPTPPPRPTVAPAPTKPAVQQNER